MTGIIEAIHLAEQESGPTFAVESVTARVGFGLDGDRLVRKAEAAKAEVEPHRQVTFIEAEALEALQRDYGIAFTAAESRRNICTRGAALNHLVHREFRAGDATLRGVELCEPCGLIEKLSGKKGVTRSLVHRGGLRAEVVEGGAIRVGDRLTPIEST